MPVPQLQQRQNGVTYPKEIPIASSTDATSASLQSGLKVSPELKAALDSGQLKLRVDRVLDLGDSKTAVFRVCYQAVDEQGKKVSDPIALNPPIIVESIGDSTYVNRKQNLLLKALEAQVAHLPKAIILNQDKQSPLALVVERADSPALWQELSNGGRVISNTVRKDDSYSVHNLQLVARDGTASNVVGVFQNKLPNMLPVLEYEAKRVTELRAAPQNQEAIRAKYIGARGVVLSEKGIFVTSNSELGNYYCEAMMFAPQFMAEYELGCSIIKNSKKEPLNGFIHVPSDGESQMPPPSQKLSDQQLVTRHQTHSYVMARAMLGYIDQAQEVKQDFSSLRFLITGYHGFVANNPSGEFAISAPVISDTIKKAFGDNLLKLELKSLTKSSLVLDARVLYQGKELKIEVIGASLAVDGTSLDYGEKSIQKLIREQKPEVVIGMGVRPLSDRHERFYDVGTACDNALILGSPKLKEAFGQSTEITLPDNHSLPRAIYSGDQILKVRNSINH